MLQFRDKKIFASMITKARLLSIEISNEKVADSD